MTTTVKLDHSTVELSGMNLIEASAGTGKTYAIASLYLRLLVEKELVPEQILVVTYTEAATQELRTRIRNRIREALEVMEGLEAGDPFLAAFLERADKSGKERVRELLEGALESFDTASIFTIHGFCLRALQDNAFESGSLYDTELVTSQSDILQEIVDDFWRMHFFSRESPLFSYALKKASPEEFMKLLNSLHAGIGEEVIPEFSDLDVMAVETSCREAYGRVSALWVEEKDTIKELFLNDKGLSRSAKNYKLELLPALFEAMDRFEAGANPYDLFDGFELFTESGIEAGMKQNKTAPQHALFRECEALLSAVEQRYLALLAELVRFCRESLPRRKRSGNVRFFDDLLDDLYHALDSGRGAHELALLLRTRYKAALIDEFQDTDPVQYEIFRKIYADSDAPLFLIGDPKQAIYSFRGADIFAYLRAAREVSDGHRFTLTSNWRSVPELLRAFNIVFDQERNPFVHEGIVYHPLESGLSEDAEAVADSGAECSDLPREAPMQILFMDPSDGAGVLKSGSAEEFAASATALRIMQLLMEGRERKSLEGKWPVNAGEIAVIVRTHRQAVMVQDALRSRGIAGVMRSDVSVFASTEAEEVRRVISAIADPAGEMKVRGALVTDMLGRSGNDIDGLLDDETAWVDSLREFRSYHDLWRERGFMVMARELLSKEGIRGRLLGSSDLSGERRLTNLLHCFELLHHEEHLSGLGMEGLTTWFSERIAALDKGEEYQIRLESDEAAVKILTIHVSKGLEFPVVFCPFLLGGINAGGQVAAFHDRAGRLVKDFGSPDFQLHRSLAEKETLAENLRLLYVALTRAKIRCYLFAGKVVDGRSSSRPVLSGLSWLLHASSLSRNSENPVITAGEEVASLSPEAMAGQLEQLAAISDGAIGFCRVKPESVAGRLEPAGVGEIRKPLEQHFKGKVDDEWKVSSFTSFSRQKQKPAELPDRDEPESPAAPPAAAPAEKSIFTFPRGAQAGILMHGIFEQLDFSSPHEERVRELVKEGLGKYGYDEEWEPHLSGMVRRVLSAPLSSPEGPFTLGALLPDSWVTELEFFFPLRMLTSERLGAVLVRHGFAASGTIDLSMLAESLSFKPAKGVVMGFMDMVFEHGGRYYLLDWKSNHLGNSAGDYHSQALCRAMEEHLYPLQYLLYTVALNRYLSLRVKGYRYSSHFGGVIYVFLRGVSVEAAESTGFFRDLPPEELVEELTAILIDQDENGEVKA